jgi:hypothetical protein
MTKHATDREIYNKFKKSSEYLEHLEAHPSKTICFAAFAQAKCRCIGDPHQRECADEVKTEMRELLLALARLRLLAVEKRKTCNGPVCGARAAATAARSANPAAPADSLNEEQTPAYRFSEMHVKSFASLYRISRAMMCDRVRCPDLELTTNDEEQVLMYKKECAYGDCESCGVEERFYRCPCEDTDQLVKLRVYELQPRTVKGEDDDGNPISSTKAVKELTEVRVLVATAGSKEQGAGVVRVLMVVVVVVVVILLFTQYS